MGLRLLLLWSRYILLYLKSIILLLLYHIDLLIGKPSSPPDRRPNNPHLLRPPIPLNNSKTGANPLESKLMLRQQDGPALEDGDLSEYGVE